MDRTFSRHTLYRRLGLSFAVAVALFVLGAIMDAYEEWNHIHGLLLYVDDLLVGILAGMMVFVYEERRHRMMSDKIRVIDEMNHHVRNALQAIAISTHVEEAEKIGMLDDACKRIEWALREILPGEHLHKQ
jgi:hypothetical protein